MKYQVAVYFEGPKSVFAGKLHQTEVVYLADSPWLWLARMMARSMLGNTGRLAYVITSGEKTVEQKAAPVTYVASL